MANNGGHTVTTEEITDEDVRGGRGSDAKNHVGNKKGYLDRLQQLYQKNKECYDTRVLCEIVVEEIKKRGGRFLKKTSNRDSWLVLDHEDSVNVAMQAFGNIRRKDEKESEDFPAKSVSDVKKENILLKQELKKAKEEALKWKTLYEKLSTKKR